MNSYELKLKSYNISFEVEKFIQKQMQGEEVQLPILCQLSKNLIDIPVRHQNIKMLLCIFDLNSLLEYCQVAGLYNKVFICPGCKNNTVLENFGVDINLYHTLEAFKLFKQLYIRIYPKKYVDESQLFYQSSENNSVYQYQCRVKVEKKASKFEKVIVPGTSAILGIQKRIRFNDYQQIPQKIKISENMAFTIQKLSDYLNRKIYKIIKEREIPINQLQKLIEPKKSQISLLFRNTMQLISLGKKSLKSDFIFAFKKIQYDIDETKFTSLLIVYYVYYDVWHEYNIEINNNPMNILGQQLYIKEFRNGSEHYLYIIGGRNTEFEQSSQFLRIRIPCHPFEQKEAKIEILPNLPVEGYNFMGTTYQGTVYVFYGQKQFLDKEKYIQNELLNTTYAYKNNKWEKIKLQLENRFDGSFFVCQDKIFDKIVIFFGGQTCSPKGKINLVEAQTNIQIFSCKEEALLGNKQKFFNLQFSKKPGESYQQKVLCAPLFSCPYYDRNQLILSGEFLRKPFQEEITKGRREVFNLDWENGILKLNEIFSFEPPEQILTTVREYGKKESFFKPVDDLDGCVAYGQFYTIFHSLIESQDNSIIQLLTIDLTNTQFRVHQYQDNFKSVEKSKKITERFENRENISIL